jgi:hypothetical protein
MASYFNNPSNKSGEKKEEMILNFLSDKYNVKRYLHNYYVDDWNNVHFDQDIECNGKIYKCPDLYILETKEGKNIILRIEIKGFRELNSSTFSGTEIVSIEKYKFDYYLNLQNSEEVESSVLFVIGNENLGFEDFTFYWETLNNLTKIKNKTATIYKYPSLCWRTKDLKYGIDGFLNYIDDCVKYYW